MTGISAMHNSNSRKCAIAPAGSRGLQRLLFLGRSKGNVLLALLFFLMGPWSCSLAAQLGDLDGDGKVTILDLVILNGYLNGQMTLTSGQMQAADLNQNGFITQADAALLANAI